VLLDRNSIRVPTNNIPPQFALECPIN
jgi:hypothetical protein